jgi:organic radical activating enzyme
MNIVLTTQCSKNCPYCFAAYSRAKQSKQEISVQTFREIMEKMGQRDSFKVLGGEPTDHPQFIELMRIAHKAGKKVGILSNFLFNNKIRNFLSEEILDNRKYGFLVNASDLDEKNRMSLWRENYNQVYQALYQKDLELKIVCGTTIDHKKTADYYKHYIDFLLANTIAIEKLRFAIPFQGGPRKSYAKIINNKMLGATVLTIVKHCVSNDVLPLLDEVLFPCLFNNKDELRYIRKFLMNKEEHFKCKGIPFDVFPDKTISYCYPLKEIVNVHLDDYDNINEAICSIKNKYMIMKHDAKKHLPQECLQCQYHKQDICEGIPLCLSSDLKT